MVDASPLIYLAKLDALDVFSGAGHQALVTPAVERETARSGLSYMYPDASLIAEALRNGLLERTELTEQERETAERLTGEAGGLDPGESEVLATAAKRSLPALLYDRRATRLAYSLGIEAWSPPDLIVVGTPDRRLAGERLISFGRLVQLRFEELEQLLARIEDKS